MSAAVRRVLRATTAALLAVACGHALAQAGGKGAILPGAAARDPVSIEAGKLDYFDKEQKLVYTGDVRARQGDTTLRASVLTIFLTKGAKASEGAKGGDAGKPQDGSALDAAQAGTSVSRMEVAGPVTVVSKEEVGTGDNGTYDKAANTITLKGNVTLSQGTNVIKGDTLVYDMTSGQARVAAGATQPRVSSVFTPGSGGPGPGGPPARKGKAKGGGAPAAKGAPPPAQAAQ